LNEETLNINTDTVIEKNTIVMNGFSVERAKNGVGLCVLVTLLPPWKMRVGVIIVIVSVALGVVEGVSLA
jgi:hypothetical protein